MALIAAALTMCGVSSRLGRCARLSPGDQLERMNDRMTHRGPDGSGVDIVGHVGLAHRRLAIIDVHGAKQPMPGPRGAAHRSCIEIYNFRALRRELEAPETRIHAGLGREVLAHAAAQWGHCLDKLNGMFAVVVDAELGVVWAARDRMGPETALRRQRRFGPGPWCGFSPATQSLSRRGLRPQPRTPPLRFLAYDFVPGNEGIFEGVESARERSGFSTAKSRLAASSADHVVDPLRRRGNQRAVPATDLDEAIDHAVQARLVADVPLGIFLHRRDRLQAVQHAIRHTDPAPAQKPPSVSCRASMSRP